MNQSALKKNGLHTISLLVANKPGVLVRCAQVFARRGFNIDALVVSPSANPKYSRMTITLSGDPATLGQIIKQTLKLVDVIHCSEHTRMDAIDKEFSLVKIKSTPANKARISQLAKKFHTRIVDESDQALIVEQSGTTAELDKFEALIKKYGIIEMVRSGKLVMAKGKEPT
jgi:acetolactate synthase I/III small subunit